MIKKQNNQKILFLARVKKWLREPDDIRTKIMEIGEIYMLDLAPTGRC